MKHLMLLASPTCSLSQLFIDGPGQHTLKITTGARRQCTLNATCQSLYIKWQHWHWSTGGRKAYFFSSHLEGMKRLLGSGAADRGMISLSSLNQLTSGSYGLICQATTEGSEGAKLGISYALDRQQHAWKCSYCK